MGCGVLILLVAVVFGLNTITSLAGGCTGCRCCQWWQRWRSWTTRGSSSAHFPLGRRSAGLLLSPHATTGPETHKEKDHDRHVHNSGKVIIKNYGYTHPVWSEAGFRSHWDAASQSFIAWHERLGSVHIRLWWKSHHTEKCECSVWKLLIRCLLTYRYSWVKCRFVPSCPGLRHKKPFIHLQHDECYSWETLLCIVGIKPLTVCVVNDA